MLKTLIRTFAIGLSLVAAGTLDAQTRFRLADPQAFSGAGSGWAVEPGTGALSFAIPIATAPGEIPIPAVFQMAANHTVQRRKAWSSEQVGNRPIWTLDSDTNIHHPILGTLHFGYIDNGGSINGIDNSATYVIEDGTQFKQEDWVAFSTYNSTFTLPQDFGLAAAGVSTVKVSSNRAYAYYTTTAAGLGTTVNAKVQATLPVGHTATTQYCVILDKDRARVMAFLSGLNAWAPLLWLDRFGHQVAFKWTMSKMGLPAGATALHSVVATNQRSGQAARGLQVQWATWTDTNIQRDLLRADFVGIDAPSILVRGYSGQPTIAPVGMTPTAAPDGDVMVNRTVAGVRGRPTVIQVGHSTMVPDPIWSGSGSALPKVQPIIVIPPPELAFLQWQVTYDANKAAVTGFTDAMGVTTEFEYGATGIYPYPYAQGVRPGFGNTWKHGVAVATSTDSQQDPVSLTIPQLKRTWIRTAVVNNSWTTTYQEWWPSTGPAERKVELGFGSATQAVHYANNSMALERILSPDGVTEYAKMAWTLDLGGLTGDESITSGIEVTRRGEASYRKSYGYANGQPNLVHKLAGPSDGILGGESALEQTSTVYDVRKEKLDVNRPTQVTVTRSDGAGTILTPSRITKYEYDATTRLLKKAYLDGAAAGQIGSTQDYDSEGRPSIGSNFSSFSTDGVATEIRGYGSDGYLNGVSTVFTRPPNQTGANSVSQVPTFDTAGRLKTQTDVFGVLTTTGYDTLGRITSRTRQGETSVSYSYLGPRTTQLTQNGQSSTILTDGFGRILRKIQPDSRKIEFFYDVHGRKVVQKEFNILGGSYRSSSSTFDPLDRLTGSASPGGSNRIIVYTATPDLKKSIVTTSIAGLTVSRKETRNVMGEVVEVQEPNNAVTTLTYDGAGNAVLVSIKDSSNHIQDRVFKYNALGLLTEKIEPETGKQTFGNFNAQRKPTLVYEAADTEDCRIRTLSYDGLGRVCKVTASTGNDTIENFFNGAFLRKATSGPSTPVVMDFLYKPAAEGSRLASETTTESGISTALTYAYKVSGQLDTITYPSGRIVGYTYDNFGRVIGIQDRSAGGSTAIVSNIDFNEWGQRKRLTFGSTAYSDWSTQDSGTHLKDWTIGYTSGGFGDSANPRNHTYDLAERLTSAGEWRNILHDSANRVSYAEAPILGVSEINFGHDGFGNNTSHLMTGTSESSFNNFSFDPLTTTNQIPSNTRTNGDTGWKINGLGEATRIGTGTSTYKYLGLGWDALGRLKSLTSEGMAQSYTYAPSGMRIRVADSTSPSNNRRYTYTSGGQLMSEYLDTGWKRDVIYIGSEAVAEIDNGGIHELHSDHLGSPRIVTNGVTAQIEGKQTYGPYGEYLTSQTVGYKSLTGYTGHLQNEPTGLIYMRGRFYSPAWHRFVNSDQGVDPNSWNQMSYVGGNSFMATDPSGMMISLTCRVTNISIEWDSTVVSPTGNTVTHGHYVYTIDCIETQGGGLDGGVPPQIPQPKPDPCAGQISALQQANDAGKQAADSKAAMNYLANIGTSTVTGAGLGAVAGGETGAIVGGLFGFGVGAAPVGGGGALLGGFIGGLGGLVQSSVKGGIQLRQTYTNNTNNWSANYRAIQNFSNSGCNGAAPEIRY